MTYDTTLFENIRNTKDQVEYILKKHPIARDSDPELLRLYCKEFNTNPFEVFEKVKRNRQKIQEGGKYWPTKLEVAKQRKMNIETWQRALGYVNQLPF